MAVWHTCLMFTGHIRLVSLQYKINDEMMGMACNNSKWKAANQSKDDDDDEDDNLMNAVQCDDKIGTS